MGVSDEILKSLKEKEDSLRDQLKEIRTLKDAIKSAGTNHDNETQNSLTQKRSGQLTFKDMTISVLRDRGQGVTANEILELISQKFGKKIERSSLSPQLSRLKKNGDLFLEDSIWYLPEQRPEDVNEPKNDIDRNAKLDLDENG